MPAIQTLMLFAKKICTNSTLTKFVFDDFLLIHTPYFGQGNIILFIFFLYMKYSIFIIGKSLLFRAIKLRKIWKNLLESKLRNDELNADKIFTFKKDLISFMNTEVNYNIKRLLPADLKTIFVFHSDEIFGELFKNPFDDDFKPISNNTIGGLNVTEYAIYNCLVQEEWDEAIERDILVNPLNCRKCENIYVGHSMWKLFCHETFCITKTEIDTSDKEKYVIPKPNSKLFHCEICKSDLHLTPTEILKHKKSCKQ